MVILAIIIFIGIILLIDQSPDIILMPGDEPGYGYTGAFRDRG